MILWMILTLITALAVAGLTIPLARRREGPERGSTLAVLKAQLADIDSQAAAGAILEADAETLRGEVKRRVLAEARDEPAPGRPLSERSLIILTLGLAGIVAIAATGLYALMGRPDLARGAAGPSAVTQAGAHPGGQDVGAMIGELEARLKASPNDAEGLRMLGWSYFQTGRFAEAAGAYGRAAQIDPTNAEYLSAQGESLVQAAAGQVTPPARLAFEKALAASPRDPRARYFLAVAKDQGGDREGAMADWIALLRSAPPGAAWAVEVRGFVETLARERGEDISGQLPPLQDAAPIAGPIAPGPTADQVAAASRMSAGDQQTMIQGMVDGLDARLKANPRDADGWVRLMHARVVLGQVPAAAQAYRDALKAFAGDPATQARLTGEAKGMNLPGA